MNYSIGRAVKFLLYITVVFTLIYTILLAVGMSDVPLDGFVDFLKSSKGMMMLAVMLGMSAIYPFIGGATLKLNPVEKEVVVELMKKNRFKLKSDRGTILEFIPARTIDRIMYRFDDTVVVDFSDSSAVTVTGARRIIYPLTNKIGSEK